MTRCTDDKHLMIRVPSAKYDDRRMCANPGCDHVVETEEEPDE